MAESEEDMIRLTKIFDLLGNDTFVSIKEGEKKYTLANVENALVIYGDVLM